jgi:hypothetical protein
MDTIVRTRSIMLVAGGAVVVLAIIGIILASGSSPGPEPGTPEATVHDYYRALIDRDVVAADALLTSDVGEACPDRLRQFLEASDRLRVVIADVDRDDASATVVVRITETYDDNPLSLDTHVFDEVLTMERTGDRWLISGPPWPLHCPGG